MNYFAQNISKTKLRLRETKTPALQNSSPCLNTKPPPEQAKRSDLKKILIIINLFRRACNSEERQLLNVEPRVNNKGGGAVK